MKKNIIILLCLSLITLTNSFSQTTPEQMVKNMGRGINLGNVMSAPTEGNWAPAVTEKYFTDVATAGFSTVRIPMDFFGDRTSGSTSSYSSDAGTSGNYTGSIADYTVDSIYLDRVEEVLDWATGKGLKVILDMHGSKLKTDFIETFDAAKSEYTDPTSAKRLADMDKFKAIWTAIANHLKDKSDDILFEVINEPYFHISDSEMNTINTSIISIIRSTGSNNTTRKIIITGGTKNSYETPTTINPAVIASDDYLIATFHYYLPFKFTSSSKDGKDQFSWGDTVDKAAVNAHFESVKTWSENYNIPVFLGEFGADNTGGYKYSTGDLSTINSNATGYANGGPDNASRVEFHRYIAEQAINRGFAFTVWDSGPASNKTIHKRTDATSTVNYNISNFSVTSYNPKVTTVSTVVDTTTWVTDVKDALFSSGTWPTAPTCDAASYLVSNRNFECGYNDNWSLSVSGAASASFSDATTNSKTGSVGAAVNVTTADIYNKVLLKNTAYTTDISNKQITIKCFAKGSTTSQTMKIRVKAISDGVTSFTSSSAISLDTLYHTEPYELNYDVPENTSSLEIHILLGKNVGIYYLDDFDFAISAIDVDGDGYERGEDCNDNDAAINPGATEILYNGIDDDCDVLTTDEPAAICYSATNLVSNSNFECGYNDKWSMTYSGNAYATFSDAGTDSRTGSIGAAVNVSTAHAYNKVILKNTAYTTDISNEQIVINCFAKASTASQTMKIRVKAISDGVTSFTSSSAISLSTSYPTQAYGFTYDVPSNTTSIEVHVLLGNETGIYYLDDFYFTITGTSSAKSSSSSARYSGGSKSQSTEITNEISSFKLYPNPATEFVNIKFSNFNKQIASINIIDLNGRVVLRQTSFGNTTNNLRLNVNTISPGLYLMQVTAIDNSVLKIKRFIIQ